MNEVIIIPARMESKRLPGKPLLEKDGIPLIWYTYENCMQVAPTYIVTDSMQIEERLRDYSTDAVIFDPRSAKNGTQRIYNALDADLISGIHDNTKILGVM